jgi:hypothetical protein
MTNQGYFKPKPGLRTRKLKSEVDQDSSKIHQKFIKSSNFPKIYLHHPN